MRVRQRAERQTGTTADERARIQLSIWSPGIGRACGMRTLAEGVETARQLQMATDLGCTFVQGFHIAPPMPAEDVAPWVLARRKARSRRATASGPVRQPA